MPSLASFRRERTFTARGASIAALPPRLVKALGALGYVVDRQKGSHVRITTQRDGEHHQAIPNHHPIKVGTLPASSRASPRTMALASTSTFASSDCKRMQEVNVTG